MSSISLHQSKPYWVRVIKKVLSAWIFIVVFASLYMVQHEPSMLWLFFWFFCFFTIRGAIWAKYNLIDCEVKEEHILFRYQKFDEELTTTIKADDLNLIWTGIAIKGRAWKLKVYSNDELRFSQSIIGKLNLDKIQEFLEKLYTEINKEPSLDTRMTLDWWKKKTPA